MSLNQIARRAYDNSAAHGFWDDLPWDPESDYLDAKFDPDERAIYYGNKLMLIVGEVSEAHEELRKNTDPRHVYHREDGKPEGLPFELADIIIRVGDLAAALDLDLEGLVVEKMAYNASRPPKHGKAF